MRHCRTDDLQILHPIRLPTMVLTPRHFMGVTVKLTTGDAVVRADLSPT
jgi:hypothetical protein